MSIQKTTLDLYGVLANEEGDLFFPVFNKDVLAAYIYRATAKNFYMIKQNEQELDPKQTIFFGQHAFETSNNSLIYIVPSLRGTLVAYEKLKNNTPVVGAVFSFIGLRRQLDNQKEFLNKFDKVYLVAECEEDEEDFKKDFSDYDYIVL